MTYFISFITVLLMVLFLAICIWAWSKHNKAKFSEAARLPLQDDDDVLEQPHTEKTSSSADSQETKTS